MKPKNLFPYFLCLLFSSASLSLESQVNIVSSDPGPGLRTVMAWPPFANASAYQIYRKEAAAAAYPSTSINPSGIAPLTNCTAIRTLLLNPDSTAWKMVAQALADTSALFDPCNIAAIPAGSARHQILLQLAARNLAIAKAAGLAFEDATVVNGQQYRYRIAAVDGSGNELGLIADDLNVTAGVVNFPPAPGGLIAEAGDSEVLIRWDEAEGASGYLVYRSVSPGGYYQRINETAYMSLFKNRLNGDTLIPATFGFLDFQRWDDLGNFIPHPVQGSDINGPYNGYTYYFKLQAVDLLERPGPMSPTFVSAMPTDQTVPAVPSGLTTVADETSANGSVDVSWQHVTLDANGHLEMPGVVEYLLYRFETSMGNPDSIPKTLVTGTPIPAPPPAGPVQLVSAVDNSPGLRAQYGNQTWWYRVRAVDNAGNLSRWSAAFSATLKDITQPDIPTGLTADGFEDRIELQWSANTETDLQGYQVYRSFCHYGEWVPCPEARPVPDPNCPPCKEDPNFSAVAVPLPQPCSGPFVFLGEITADSLERALSAGLPAFIDTSIPAGSSVCYAYWIKAIDHSGNRSGDFPFPSPAEELQIGCERLRDKTPPEPALISGLFARDDAIRVEWIAPPTPDIKAYHVYRAKEVVPQVEPTAADFEWIGGLTVELPPAVPVLLTEPYQPLGFSTCDLIPVEGTENMSSGFLTDRNVEPRTVYWYKVVGIDYDGNEGLPKEAVSASTFTFQTTPTGAPLVESILLQSDTCGIRLQWFPAFDPAQHRGFLLYKSMEAAGPYIQLASLLTENTYLDRQVVKGRTYWYKLAIVQRDGKLSEITTEAHLKPEP